MEPKILRLLDPQGEPDIIECDGKRYVPERTCRNVSTCGEFLCSVCDQRIYGSKGETHDVNFKYKRIAHCPNCGAKVVE